MGRVEALLASALLLAPAAAAAADHVWLIGGGYDPDSAQAQIERNVLWVSQLLRQPPGHREVRIYFNDGNDPAADVKELVPLRGGDLEPLRRLFADGHVAGYRYRDHAIPGVRGGTEVTALRAVLTRDIARLAPGDRLLVVFNGHGTRGRLGPSGNRLWLWHDTSLDVREFGALLDRVPASVTVRFVLTQCYAGAFARLAPGPDGNRCGFLAESADQPAEGCAAGVDAGDYRDYTTYFFAALSGRTRLDEPLLVNPDLDGDSRVSFYEAHLYALRVGESADLPRTTSEVFLERWQPWYADLRALFGFNFGFNIELPDNDYARLARELAAPLALPESDRALRRALRRLRAAETRQARAVQRRQRELRRTTAALQVELREQVAVRWPQVQRLEREGLPVLESAGRLPSEAKGASFPWRRFFERETPGCRTERSSLNRTGSRLRKRCRLGRRQSFRREDAGGHKEPSPLSRLAATAENTDATGGGGHSGTAAWAPVPRGSKPAAGRPLPKELRLGNRASPLGSDGGLGEIAAFVRAQPRYGELVRAQDEHEANERALLDGERRVTRLDKIERLQKLARLQDRFAAQASSADRATYGKLLACERQGL